ncbi:MAG: hypothetical protein HDT28_00085 [Clostridiales bacterium]|nr:hypothetical protein [Clostridiales bacterium]
MAKKDKNNAIKSDSVTVVKSHRKANIAVSIIGGIAALIIITIIVLCAVRVDPLSGLGDPVRYDFYGLSADADSPESTNDKAQTKIKDAVGEMDFSVMSAVLQWKWDYTYNFVKSTEGEKIKMDAHEIEAISATADAYMIEFVYAPAEIVDGEVVTSSVQSLKVDGEVIYFDRVKVVIENTDRSVGDIYLYPYIYDRVMNEAADDGVTHENYYITAVKVRGNTTAAYAALTELAQEIKNG